MREYSATVGATDGSIIAAIITAHAPRNQPSVPSPVHGPLSMPRIRSPVDHQPMPASAKSAATSASRARTATNAGARPAPPRARCCAEAITGSSGPGELGRRESGLALVLDPERVDPRALRLRHREIGRHGVEHAGEPHGLTGLDAEGHDVLDLEVDRVPDAHAMAQAVVGQLDPRPFDAEHLAHQRPEAR